MAELNLNKMKEILKSKNLTYDELSEITKISKSSISKIFGGFNQNPTLKYLKEIAFALDCSIDDFFDNNDNGKIDSYTKKEIFKTAKYSVEKLVNKKKQNGLTNKRISELIQVPIVTVDRLFSGRSLNPTIKLLLKVASALGCTVNDFIDYDNSLYCAGNENNEVNESPHKIADNPYCQILFETVKSLKPDDLIAVIDIANRIKGNY